MAWLLLSAAGLLEVFWATFLKLSEGFTKVGYSALTVAGMLASFFLLSKAVKVLPMGTAYAIWAGIGAVGALIVGVVFFKEPLTAKRILFAVLLIAGIIGLKATAAG